MIPRISNYDWLQLPNETRQKLAQVFGLKKSTGSTMLDNKQISDGYTQLDLAPINIENMQSYLDEHVENDFARLFDRVLGKINLTPIKSSDEIESIQKHDRITRCINSMNNLKKEAEDYGIGEQFNELVINLFIKPNVQRTNQQVSQTQEGAVGVEKSSTQGVGRRGKKTA